MFSKLNIVTWTVS